MHELSVVQEIVRTVDEARMNAGAGLRVAVVRLKVGRLTAVVPEYVRFYYEMLTKDTPLEGGQVEFEIVPLTGRCVPCGKVFDSDGAVLICPDCGAQGEIVTGREMLVDSIEVDDL